MSFIRVVKPHTVSAEWHQTVMLDAPQRRTANGRNQNGTYLFFPIRCNNTECSFFALVSEATLCAEVDRMLAEQESAA